MEVWLGIGANEAGDFGNPFETIETTLSRLRNHANIRVVKCSSLWESPALTTEGINLSKPTYLNAVWLIETNLSCTLLLQELKRIEIESGRKQRRKWESRPLDLDILLCGNEVIQTEELQIPHPEMHQRDFVLRPILEIGDPVHPTLKLRCSKLLIKLEKSELENQLDKNTVVKNTNEILKARKLQIGYSSSSES